MDSNEFRGKARAAFTNKDLGKVFEVGAVYSIHLRIRDAMTEDLKMMRNMRGYTLALVFGVVFASYMSTEPSFWFAFAMTSACFGMYCLMDAGVSLTEKNIEKVSGEVKAMEETLKELGLK